MSPIVLRRLLALAVPCVVVVQAPQAQTTLGDSAPARAAQARAAWRRAAAAQRAGLPDSAWREVNRARDAWPVQPAYEEGVARLAARRGDANALVASLDRLARLEGGANVIEDTGLVAFAGRDDAVRRARTRVLEAIAPPRRGGDLFASAPDTTFWPEGIDVDARTRTVYVTSIRQRQVAVLADGGLRPLLASDAHVGAVLGVRVDTTRGVLWLATARFPYARPDAAADSLGAELLRVRMTDGRIERRWRLGDGTGAPGELTLAANGDVIVSDGLKARLSRLRAGADSLETITHPLLGSPQGIVVRDDGAVAWVADWTHGLLRGDLATGAFERVREPEGATLLGLDGLRAWRGRLIGIQNGLTPSRVVDITLDGDGRRVTSLVTLDRERPYAGDITVGTIIGDSYVFVSSSQWPWFDDDGKRIDARPLPGVVLRAVALRRR
jgi:hypothetical protein